MAEAISHSRRSRALGSDRFRSNSHRFSWPVLSWIPQNQIGIAPILILGGIWLHTLYPSTRSFVRKFVWLSYKSHNGNFYTKGTDDLYFVFTWIVSFTALRGIFINSILQPLAAHLSVAKRQHLRFAEQSWLVIYYGTFWTLGMHLWMTSPYWRDGSAIWAAWPAQEMSGTFKWYYLVQLAFWLQQILIVHVEARRKDHIQMLIHHFITCTLISIAYLYCFTRVANVILCLMDIVDFLLAIAKLLRYLRHEIACNMAFALLMIAWLIARHILYLQLCYTIYNDVPGPKSLHYGCYSGITYELLSDIPAQPDYFFHLLWPFRDLQGRICANQEVKWIFLGLLGLLQVLSLIWFAMILRVAVRILMGGKAEDNRSDEEENEVKDAEENHEEMEVDGRRQGHADANTLNDYVGRRTKYNMSMAQSVTWVRRRWS